MLFKETIDRLRPEVENAVDDLFTLIYQNQVHPQDLLLTEIGQFEEETNGFGPDVIGGHDAAERTQYEFYDFYRKGFTLSKPRGEAYEEAHHTAEGLRALHRTIQLELMVYLKFWETDRLLLKLHQYTQLALGKPFNWQYRIDPDMKRHDLIRNLIRDPLEKICPAYFQLLKTMYRSQVRNAIAHSQFYLADRNIGFTNYKVGTHADLEHESIEWWEEMFHRVILFYNELLRHQDRIGDRAKRQDKLSLGKGLEIRCTNPSRGFNKIVHWAFNHKLGMWDWADNISK